MEDLILDRDLQETINFRNEYENIALKKVLTDLDTHDCGSEVKLNSSHRYKLFLGGVEIANRFNKLDENNIKTIISLSSEPRDLYLQSQYFQLNIKHFHHVIEDEDTAQIYHILDLINNQILNGLVLGNVLIHCRMGMSRSVSCVLYLLLQIGSFDSLREAYEYLTRCRSICLPNVGFLIQVYCLYKMAEDPIKYQHIIDLLCQNE